MKDDDKTLDKILDLLVSEAAVIANDILSALALMEADSVLPLPMQI